MATLNPADQKFDLLNQEAKVILGAVRFLEDQPSDMAGLKAALRDLILAFQQSTREQKRLMRAGDRQQEQLRQVSKELMEKSRLLEDQARHLLILNTELGHEVETRKALEVELRIQATTDPLTGIYNRRRFLELGHYEHAREVRNLRGLSVLVLDIDHFKKVNDTHGHGVGDDTLIRFAQLCRTCLRALDTIGRIGGEEFAILLPETALADACQVAERMRAAVEACTMAGQHEPFQITVSIGVAQVQKGETFDALMARSDQQLYAAKHGGRNRVYCGEE
jgi:diguanylate cyclase (GGDEF)-like protein